MKNDFIRQLVFTAMLLAMGLLLPFLTLNNPQLGSAILLMHIPVLLCGVLVSPRHAFILGAVLPLMRSILIGAPPLFPIATAMAFELAAYGLVIGLLYAKLPKSIPIFYGVLVGAMLAGRVVWAGAMTVISGLSDVNFSFSIFTSAAFVNSIPGIALQLILIPVIVSAFKPELGWKKA